MLCKVFIISDISNGSSYRVLKLHNSNFLYNKVTVNLIFWVDLLTGEFCHMASSQRYNGQANRHESGVAIFQEQLTPVRPAGRPVLHYNDMKQWCYRIWIES